MCKLKLDSEHANLCKHKPKVLKVRQQFGTKVETQVNSNFNDTTAEINNALAVESDHDHDEDD